MVPKLNPENLEGFVEFNNFQQVQDWIWIIFKGIQYNAMLIRDNVEATDNGEQIDLFKKAASILNDILQQVKIKPFFKKKMFKQ